LAVIPIACRSSVSAVIISAKPRAIADRRDSVFLMTTVCPHGRDATVALRQLDESMRRLRTDHLDLWQVHECVYDNDPERHFARGGVIEALERAKSPGQGQIRRLHRTQGPRRSTCGRCRSTFRSTPVSCRSTASTRGSAASRGVCFQRRVLPELARRRIAAIGMKSLGGDGRVIKKKRPGSPTRCATR